MEEENKSYEFNSYGEQYHFCCDFNYLSDSFSEEEIKNVLNDPITYHGTAKRISNIIYNKNGIVSNTIDYLTALPNLYRVINCRTSGGGLFDFLKGKLLKSYSSTKVDMYKKITYETLQEINDRHFVRDALFTMMNDGIFFYYFDTEAKNIKNNNTVLSDYDIETLYEVNEFQKGCRIVTLPYRYTKIVGKCGSRYRLAFDLKYFESFSNPNLRKRKLLEMPKEIRNAYKKLSDSCSNKHWVLLDPNKTMCKKIKSKDSEIWGRPLALSALTDILYQDKFVNTKRNVLDELNNKIIYQTFPEGKEKGKSALTEPQQRTQHDTIKRAVLQKNNIGGTSFFSVAAGTKLDTLDTSSDILDSKNEENLNDQIALGMGVAASLLNGSGSGNYSSQQNNLDLISAQVFSWVQEIQNELNTVINANVIKDKKYYVECVYLPTSLVNNQKFYDMMLSLYNSSGGSLSLLIAATGIDPEVYLSILNEETEAKIFEKFQPHQTSYTLSNKDNKVGAPSVDDPTSYSTIVGKSNGTNSSVRNDNE